MNFNKFWKEFTTLPEVEAIALGGSRLKQIFDEKADNDLYFYCNEIPIENILRRILQNDCHYMELGDNCTLKDGMDFDIFYQSLEYFSQQIYSVIEEYTPSNGYPICMWHDFYIATFNLIRMVNWKNCKICIKYYIQKNYVSIL